jgi:hypothetical protein
MLAKNPILKLARLFLFVPLAAVKIIREKILDSNAR